MAYTVTLTDTQTGAMKTVEMDGAWDNGAEFLWTDGNYACDCNRGRFFGLELPCTSERIEAELPPITDTMKNEYWGF